jgi:hypothetical protein
LFAASFWPTPNIFHGFQQVLNVVRLVQCSFNWQQLGPFQLLRGMVADGKGVAKARTRPKNIMKATEVKPPKK